MEIPVKFERLSQAFLSLPGRARTCISIAILLLLTEAVYVRPWFVAGGGSLLGMDYFGLHIHRIAFAREALLGPAHFLPGWYPREWLGSPFLANLQNFPWIPTRLILLFFDPLQAYAVGVALAAALAALFTYLFCKRAGLSEIGAITAGWTFACAGFFASRVMAGHLPLLEAYPSLPLLLWLADRAVAPLRSQYAARDLAILALASASVAAAGHPQLPAYSLAAAALYIIIRGRGWRRLKVVFALALGVGTTLVVWWPMFLLIQRSTRVLHLATPSNDVVMPLRRLAALIRPGIDGWPDAVGLTHQKPFQGYLSDAYFWDTCSYVGLLPLAILIVLLLRSVMRRRLPGMPWVFPIETVPGVFERRLFLGHVFVRGPAAPRDTDRASLAERNEKKIAGHAVGVPDSAGRRCSAFLAPAGAASARLGSRDSLPQSGTLAVPFHLRRRGRLGFCRNCVSGQ